MNEAKLFAVVIMLFFSACLHPKYNHSKRIVNVAKPVTLIADTSLFQANNFWPDSTQQFSFYYSELLGLKDNRISLTKEGSTNLFINEPTYLSAMHVDIPYLVYPGEEVTVKMKVNGDLSYTIKNKAIRNSELKAFEIYWNKRHEPAFSYNSQIPWRAKVPADSIPQIEKRVKDAISLAKKCRLAFLDSLFKTMPVSDNFTQSFNYLLYYDSIAALSTLYFNFKTELVENKQYSHKLKELIAGYKNIENENVLFYYRSSISLLFLDMLSANNIPTKMRTAGDFTRQYGLADSTFKGLARDYMLSKIIYNAIVLNLPLVNSYLSKYESTCSSVDYKRAIKTELRKREIINSGDLSFTGNDLVAIDKKRKTNIESLIAQNKGNVLLLDFWASWCIPCREELPFSRKLESRIANKNFKVINISLDKDIDKWKKASLTEKMENRNSFLLANFDKSGFIHRYDIMSIPRYILIAEDGSIINDKVPPPSDATVYTLVNKSLNELK